MAQTGFALSKSNFMLEVSINGVDWIDIRGTATKATPSGGDQMIGSVNTADGHAPVVTHGNKTGPNTLQCNIVYTEVMAESFMIVRDVFESDDKSIFVRYSPRGGNPGDIRYYTADDSDEHFRAPIVNCLPPEGDASTGDPLVASFSVQCPKFAQEVVAEPEE